MRFGREIPAQPGYFWVLRPGREPEPAELIDCAGLMVSFVWRDIAP